MTTSRLADLYVLDPEEFERLVGKVFESLGYEVRLTKRSGDEGIDLELVRGDERSLAQCKRYRGTVGQPDIRDFYGVLVHEGATRGYFVTTGQFSLAASTWAQGKPIALVDGVDFLAALAVPDAAPRHLELLENSGTAVPVGSPVAEHAEDRAARILAAARRSPEDHLAALQLEHLQANLSVLSGNERTVIESRLGLNGHTPQTPHELSDELRMTLEGVRRIEVQALDKLTRAGALSRSSAGATGAWNDEQVMRVSREQVAQALVSRGMTINEQAARQRLMSCLATLGSFERLVVEMWAGFKDGRAHQIDTISTQVGLPVTQAAATQVEALERLARLWSDSAPIGDAFVANAADEAKAVVANAAAEKIAGRERQREAHWKFRYAHAVRPMHRDTARLESQFIQRFAPISVLDAHCGAGSIARELAREGVDVVGVEPNVARFNAANSADERIEWRNAHIWNTDLERVFDAVVMADCGLLDLALGSETVVINNMVRHLRPGGILIVGFQLISDLLTVRAYDELATQAGLEFVERWSEWDCSPWATESDYAISVHRKPDRAMPTD